jgi:Zn-dependent peptidase ImmA (M78 family)
LRRIVRSRLNVNAGPLVPLGETAVAKELAMSHEPDRSADGSVLKVLRDLVPLRRLSYRESLQIAELQASRLLELFDVRGPLVPDELITELPRIAVHYDFDLPVSGSAHWENGRWIITLNASEPHVRQRFSMMHEFKHILDHTTKRYLYGDAFIEPGAAGRAERAADAFAAALLMPKRWIKARWFESHQDVALLAHRAGVSTRALKVRLYYLGLAQDSQRCRAPANSPVSRSSAHEDRRYFRSAVPPQAVA